MINKSRIFILFYIISLIFTTCKSFNDNLRNTLKNIIEYRYDFNILGYKEMYNIFESFNFLPVGSQPSWNKKIGNILCTVAGNIEEREIIISFSDYQKYKQHKGYISPASEIKNNIINEMNLLYGHFVFSDFTTYTLFSTNENLFNLVTLNSPTWELSDRNIYLLNHISDNTEQFYFVVRFRQVFE
jgi:hypothetical protein